MKGQSPSYFEYLELVKISKKMQALNKKIMDMGYSVYLANDEAHVMKGPSHSDEAIPCDLQENSVHSFPLDGWSGGDW